MKLHFSLTSVSIALLLCFGVAGCAGYASGGVDGLYFMTRTMFPSGLETATYRFHNGTVVKNPVDLAKLDPQADRASHPEDVGTYKVQGSQLVVTWPGNYQQEAKVEPAGAFVLDGGVFNPVKIFKPGATLDGTFSGGVSVAGGAISSSNTIRFKRDGTYESSARGHISSESSQTSVTANSAGTEHGKYRIDGTALHLMPAGGKETVVSTFPFGDDTKGPAPRLYFDGRMLKRTE